MRDFQYLIPPQPKISAPRSPVPPQDDDRAKRQCFAIISKLRHHFETAGISDKDIWAYMKSKRGVSNRQEFTIQDWTFIAARLFAAENHQELFTALCKEISKQKKGSV